MNDRSTVNDEQVNRKKVSEVKEQKKKRGLEIRISDVTGDDSNHIIHISELVLVLPIRQIVVSSIYQFIIVLL